ncbi:dUTP diphosphatase [Chitinophaga sp. G-6-1-13]|uniref:Deoxyuridine 5'-triphosphate nucleotidohydrolase n=1 Tax=Chitinophaga fulva TaxID=2728842 RepID=A0A848GCQ3_9BACT|nr:dUTP diphosphatase [Chitinophaga fulva]NML35736.1 dUTP diphosphatase [Chitinophaga fulva]
MADIIVKIINKSDNELPSYATDQAAGMDLRAHLETALTLQPLERVLVPTGLFMELPVGYEAQIRPRSGLAFKQGLTIPNSPGTIDADYRGEVKVIMINLSNEPQTIQPGDRVAQMIIAPYVQAVMQPVEVLNETVRGEGGFGHTGKS